MKKLRRSPVVTGLLFLLAVVLLFAGSMGGTQAALQVFSDNYISAMDMKHIGVTLRENGTDVAFRNYGDTADSKFKEKQNGDLVLKNLEDDPAFQIGRKYPFEITARNSGSIDQYLRVTIYKYWVKVGEDERFGLKGWFHGLNDSTLKLQDPQYDPDLICLGYGSEEYNSSAWVRDEASSTDERDVYYYIDKLSPEGETAPLFDTLWIDRSVAKTPVATKKDNVTIYTYAYDGYGFLVLAEVDAIQTHHARDAIRSAWGLRDDDLMDRMKIPAA